MGNCPGTGGTNGGSSVLEFLGILYLVFHVISGACTLRLTWWFFREHQWTFGLEETVVTVFAVVIGPLGLCATAMAICDIGLPSHE